MSTLTTRLREDLQDPIQRFCAQIDRSELPLNFAPVDVAKAIMAHMDGRCPENDTQSWSEIFTKIFDDHKICPVRHNYFLAIDQTVWWLIEQGRLRQQDLAAA